MRGRAAAALGVSRREAARSAWTPEAIARLANPFGLAEAIGGLVVGFVAATLSVALFGRVSGHPAHPSAYGSDVASLIGLWAGFGAAALVASRRKGGPLLERLARDFGLVVRPWPDLPVGIAVGLASQYLLVFVLELPLVPFVPHLFKRLSAPAERLTGTAHGAGVGLAVLGVLVCVGSPLFEELFFRGLLLRALISWASPLGARRGAVVAVVLVGVLFGLVHFEALQLLGLIGFGVVLSLLAIGFGRLGPGLVAHATFNAAAIISIASLR